MLNKKAQGAAEFIILIGFILFFFIAFFIVIQENIGDKTKERQNILLGEVVRMVQDEINLASESSEGYSRDFEVPSKINNQDYEINITGGEVYSVISGGKNAIALPVAEVNGEISKGINSIKKEDGEVRLNV